MTTRNRLQEAAFRSGWTAVPSQTNTDTWEKDGRRFTAAFANGRFAIGMELEFTERGGWDGNKIVPGWEVKDDKSYKVAEAIAFLKEN